MVHEVLFFVFNSLSVWLCFIFFCKVLGLSRIRTRVSKILVPDPNYFNSDPQHILDLCCFCNIHTKY